MFGLRGTEVLQIIVLLVLCHVGRNGPSLRSPDTCDRHSSAIVRHVVQSKLQPVLDRYRVEMPEDCPFHPARDVLVWPQRSSQASPNHHLDVWKCPVCGKTFFGESKLASHYRLHGSGDLDVDHSHELSDGIGSTTATASPQHEDADEDGVAGGDSESTSARLRSPSGGASSSRPGSSQSGYHVKRHISEGDRVCLGTFCDIMRCEVVERQLSEGPRPRGRQTSPQTGRSSTAATLTSGNSATSQSAGSADDVPDDFKPARESCDPQAMATLENRCRVVMQQCTIGLLNVLSVKEYKDIEGELYKNICAYLRCDRYWEEPPRETRTVSPILASFIGFLLATGFFFCYYVVWVVFDYTPIPEEAALLQKLPNGTTIRRLSSSVTITRQHSAPLVSNATYRRQRYSAGHHQSQQQQQQQQHQSTYAQSKTTDGDSVLPPEVPLRRHYSHYQERGHGYVRRDQYGTARQSLQPQQAHQQGQGASQDYHHQGRSDHADTQINSSSNNNNTNSTIINNNNNNHNNRQTTQHRSAEPVSAVQGSRFHYERPLRSPLKSKDILSKEFSSPLYQQPLKEYRDGFSAVHLSPKESSTRRSRISDYDREEIDDQTLYYPLDQQQHHQLPHQLMHQGQGAHQVYQTTTHHSLGLAPSMLATGNASTPYTTLTGQLSSRSHYDLGGSGSGTPAVASNQVVASSSSTVQQHHGHGPTFASVVHHTASTAVPGATAASAAAAAATTTAHIGNKAQQGSLAISQTHSNHHHHQQQQQQQQQQHHLHHHHQQQQQPHLHHHLFTSANGHGMYEHERR